MSRRSPAPKPVLTPEEHAALNRRADAYDLEALRETTYIHHDVDDLDIDPGDLAADAERALIQLATYAESEQAALARHLAQMRTDLDGPQPSAQERLLVDLVVNDWLSYFLAQKEHVRALRNGTLAERALAEKRLDGRHRRYLAAQRTLATVRRLVVPIVQLNLANQQVNVVAPSRAEPIASPQP